MAFGDCGFGSVTIIGGFVSGTGFGSIGPPPLGSGTYAPA